MFCNKCGASIPDGNSFCIKCGNKLNAASDISFDNLKPYTAVTPQPTDKVDRFGEFPTYNKVYAAQPEKTMNVASLIFAVIGLILWFVGPLMAVNIFTLGNQPSAFELLQDDVLHIGDLTESSAYMMALGSIIGLVICLICVFVKSNVGTRIFAALSLVPMLIGFFEVAEWVDEAEDFLEFFGFGYWGIAVCLLVLLCLGGEAKKQS